MGGKKKKKSPASRTGTRERTGTGPGPVKKTPAPAVTRTVGFVVDEALNIREFVGHTAPLLAIPSGEASLSLLRMLRPELRPPVTQALDSAGKTASGGRRTAGEGRAVQVRGPQLSISGRLRQVDVEVAPVGPDGSRGHRRRILFRYREVPSQPRRPGATTRPENPAADHWLGRLREDFQLLLEHEERRHGNLMHELGDSREDAQAKQEQLEASYAELEAANSELRAMLAERDKAEDRLRESEAASRELLETAAEGILAVDSHEQIVRVNALACKMFGYSRGELLGQKIGILLPHGLRRVHTSHVAGYFRKPERRVMGKGRDLTGLRKDGRTFPIEVGLSSVRLDHVNLAVAFISDISDRRAAEQDIVATNERLRQLSQKLTRATEEENRRWARELHDVYSQRLVGIAMALSQVASAEGSDPQLEVLEQQVRTLAADIHRLSRRMHPSILHDLGLSAALRAEAAAFEREFGVATRFQAVDVPVRLPDDVALCLYRVAQETLRNIRKHSGAARTRMSLAGRNGTLVLTIQDRGDGFDIGPALRKGGLGLISMEERVLAVGGEFSIVSTPGKGTTVRVAVPVEGRQAP